MAPPKKRALPKPLPEGFILSDAEKKKWRLGKIIGQGGFGLIYLASRDVDRPVAADADFVIKLEYQENGPLFSELKFYQRAAKPESIEKWKRSRRLDFLGVPAYWASGLAEYNNLRYRFMAMDRLGSDLQKVCERSGGRMREATVLQLGRGLVNVLEYIHENEYVHADIKAANLMLGYRDPEQVYLADYGLSYRYCPDGVHKEYKENPKKGHNGTMEYTSLDAHKGLAPSRRGDLQILGFCLLHWLCGSLPWDGVLKNPTQVQEAKTRLMDHLPGSVQQLPAGGASTDEVASFLFYVKTLGYQEKPDYQLLRAVLASTVTGRLDFSPPGGPAGESPAEAPGRDKDAAGRGSSRAKTVPTEQEEEGMKSKPAQAPDRRRPPPVKPQTPQKPAARGSSKAKTVPTEEEQEEEEGMKSKPAQVPDRRRRPPVKPQTPQKENGVPSAVRRSSRLKPGPAVNYKEVDTDDDEEEEEERTVSRPISPCYLRGPPIGPRAQPKQNAKSERSGWETRGQQAGHSRTRLWTRHDHGPGEWAGRGLTDPGQDAAPRPGSRLFSCFFFAGAILLLAALLGLCG